MWLTDVFLDNSESMQHCDHLVAFSSRPVPNVSFKQMQFFSLLIHLCMRYNISHAVYIYVQWGVNVLGLLYIV